MTVHWTTDGTLDEVHPLTDGDIQAASAQPHLIIGLGAIGRCIIAELRRTLDRPYGGRASPAVPMDYVSIDMESAPQALADIPTPPIQGDDSLMLTAKAEQLQDWLNQHAGDLLRLGGTARLVVHVVGYFAGAVGGGAVTELVVQLRRNRALAGRSHIVFYGVLPGKDRASLDGSGPVVANTGSAEVVQTELQGLCDEILVILPPVETGQMERDFSTLPKALAMTVRQRLFKPVLPVDVLPAGDQAGCRPTVAVAPVVLSTAGDDVEEALSIGLLQTALYQLIYAHWRPGRGFVGEAQPFDYADHVTRAEVQWAWLQSAEHLIQSVPTLDADGVDGRWKPLAEEWRDGNAGLFERLEGQQRKDWLDVLTRRWERCFREEFRGVGVSAFYTGRQGLRRDMARAARCKVEQSLFEGWRDGQMGLACARSMVDALIDRQRERLESVEDRVANIRLAEEACRVRTVAACQKWTRLSSSRWGRNAAVALVNDYVITLQELFVNRTRAEGWLFAKALLPMIIEELEDLRQLLDRMLRISLQQALSVDLRLDGLSARMEEGEVSRDFVQHLFDRGKLQHIARDMLIGEAAQQSHCQRTRQILTQQATPRDEFHAVVKWVESNDWMAPIAALSRDQIVGADGLWTALVKNSIDTSIYKELQAHTDGDFGRLRDLTTTLINRAISLLPETVPRETPIRVHVALPRDDGQEAFIQTLKSAFSSSCQHDISFIDVEDCCDNLSILAAAPFSISEVEFPRHLDLSYLDYAMRAVSLDRGRTGKALANE